MERILEFQKWVSDCIKDSKEKLDLKPSEVCYVLAVLMVQELLREIGRKDGN